MTDSFVKVQTPWGSAEIGESHDVNPAGRKTYRLFGGAIQRQDVPGGDWTPLTKREADMLLDLVSGMETHLRRDMK